MSFAIALYGVGTLLFILAMVRQFKIIADAKNGDPMLKGKLFFFVFNLFNVLTTITLICAFYWNDKTLLIPSSVFWVVAGLIAVWAYYSKPPKIV